MKVFCFRNCDQNLQSQRSPPEVKGKGGREGGYLFFDSGEDSCGPLLVMRLELMEGVELEEVLPIHTKDLFIFFFLKK
jgi:hypothetical protein